MKWLTDLLLSIENIDPGILFLSFLSIVFWGFILYKFHPEENGKKIKIIIIAMFLGFVSTRIILSLHPILWPEVNFKPKKTSLLTQTAYIAFIQAGAMEETFKILLIMIQGFIMSFSWKHKKWDKNIVLVGAFVALGFSFVENYIYINKDHKNSISLIATFIGRTIYSSNIHMLINICFSLFLLKTNYKDSLGEKLRLIIYAFFLAIFQHGVVDFFLLPTSRFGNWLAAALFVGIWVWVAKDLRKYVFVEKAFVEDVIKERNEENSLSHSSFELKEQNGEFDPFPGYTGLGAPQYLEEDEKENPLDYYKKYYPK